MLQGPQPPRATPDTVQDDFRQSASAATGYSTFKVDNGGSSFVLFFLILTVCLLFFPEMGVARPSIGCKYRKPAAEGTPEGSSFVDKMRRVR